MHNIICVYLAQILSGIASGSSFIITQNWLNSELERECLENKKEEIKFKGRIMKKHRVLYLYYTLIILIICAIFYTIFGITAPFWINIITIYIVISFILIFPSKF